MKDIEVLKEEIKASEETIIQLQAEIERLKTAYETLKQEYDSMFSANRNLMAEVERLKEGISFERERVDNIPNLLLQAKSEVIKEFAERLKAIAIEKGSVPIVFSDIDNLAKELTEKNNFKE